MFNLKLDVASINNQLAEQAKVVRQKLSEDADFYDLFSNLPRVDPVEILGKNLKPSQVVARRHSCEHGFTRAFDIGVCTPYKVTDTENKIILLLCMNEDEYIDAGKLAQSNTNRDTIYGILNYGYKIANTLRTMQIYHILEMERKNCELTNILADEITVLFAGSEWYNAGKELNIEDEKSFNVFLSDIFDEKYKHTPRITSEFLTSPKPSIAGTKAIKAVIRLLLEGKILKKNSPENFILDEVFKNTDIKVQNIRDEIEKFIHLSDQKTSLRGIYDRLSRAPFGLSKQMISLFLLGTLLKLNDKVAVFEDNEFQSEITVPVFENLMSNPGKYRIQQKYFKAGII